MTIATITTALLRSWAASSEKRRDRLHDDLCRGFRAVRHASKTISFEFRYFDERHREQTVSLGRFGDVTVAAARKRAVELRAQVSLGGDPVRDRKKRQAVLTVETYITTILLPYIQERQRGAKNWTAYTRRIIAHFGAMSLDTITAMDVAEFRRSLLAEGLKAGTVNRHLAAIRRTLGLAKTWNLMIGPNPATAPGMLYEQHREAFLTPDQVRALFQALDLEPNRHAATAIALLTLTGARRSEVLNLDWGDVDLNLGLLTVARSKAGRRHHIPLSPPAIQVLTTHRLRTGGTGYVFHGSSPETKKLTELRGPWKRALQAAGLPASFVLHSLRHTYASTIASAGASLGEIATVLGHSQLSTTRRYAHFSPNRLRQTASLAAQAWDLLPAADAAERLVLP